MFLLPKLMFVMVCRFSKDPMHLFFYMKLHQLKDSFMRKPIVKGDYDET